MLAERITIKGTSSGLIVGIGAGEWQGLVEELDHTLAERASFFKGGRVALQVGPRQLTRLQLETVGQVLNRHQVTLWAVESEAAGTREAAAQLGLETQVVAPKPRAAARRSVGSDTLFIRRTLRSGQVVHHPGNIIIVGDVNPGAEVKAGGSVIVWGRLRGTVFAGADNGQAKDAIICALQLSPMQLRLGELIARAPADDGEQEIMPEMASIQDGQIVAEPWHG